MSEGAAAFCPYKGLRPYEEADLPYFFGRDADSRIVAGSVLARRLTILFGASGVGKTSILRAAAIPEIRRSTGRQPIYFNTWQSADFLDRLHAAVAAELGARTDPVPAGLAGLAEAWAATAGAAATSRGRSRRPAPLVLVLDQFEEFFLYPEGPRDGFAAELAALVNRRELDARVLLCLRDDRLATLERLSARIPDILTNRVELEALDHAGASAACTGPVGRYGADGNPDRGAGPVVTIRDDLVEAILRSALLREPLAEGEPTPAELAAGRFDTAYLQLALSKVWARERDAGSTELRGATFASLGGGAGIAAAHLEDELQLLSADELFLCGRFFDRLVTSGGSKIAQPYEALRDAALPGPATTAPSWPRQLYRAFKQRLLGILVGIRAKSPPAPDRPSPLPLPGISEATAERFGRLAAGAPPADVLRELLDTKLAHASRFILRTVPSPVRGGGRAYEIFHDVLAAPLRAWTDRFRRSVEVVDGYWSKVLLLGVASVFALLLLVSAGLAAWAWRASTVAEQRANEATAALQWSRLESRSSSLAPIEIDALWTIARFTPPEREAFVAGLPGDTAHILRFASRHRELSRALGLIYVRNHAISLADALVDAIAETTIPFQLATLVQAVQGLGPSPEQARTVLGSVLDAITETSDPYTIATLVQAVQGLGPSPEQVRTVLGSVLDAIAKTPDPDPLAALAKAVQSLGLPPEQTRAAFNAIANSIKLHHPLTLAPAVQTLGTELEPKQSEDVIKVIRSALASAGRAASADAWASALDALLAAQPVETALPAYVELLKFPTAGQRSPDFFSQRIHDPTRILLAGLARLFPDAAELQGGDLDAAVAWIARTHPRIDLESPPARPAPLQAGEAPGG